MMRIIVHAGLYKTGTTSLQRYLARNRAALSPYLRYCGPGELHNAGAHARAYGQRPFPWRLARFRRALDAFLAAIPDPSAPGEPGVIVISRENFTGAMPGHRDWRGRMITGFPHSERLVKLVASRIGARFGSGVDTSFLITTRDRDSWLRSIHGHLLRSIALTDDFDAFRARFPSGFGPDGEAARLARCLAPLSVHVARLEELADRHEGPAAAILDLVGIPPDARAALAAAAHANVGEDEALRRRFLELNRQGLSRSYLRAAKRRLLTGETR